MISDEKFKELETELNEKGLRGGEEIFEKIQREIPKINNPEDKLVFLAVIQASLIHGINRSFKKFHAELYPESPE